MKTGKRDKSNPHIRNFAACLADLLAERGMDVRQLALESGLSRQHISYLLRGERDPRISTVVILADTLDVTTDYLLGYVKA